MPQGTATRNPAPPSPVNFFWLNGTEDIVPMISALSGINWRTKLETGRDSSGVMAWSITVSPEDTTTGLQPVDITLGDVLVWDGVEMTKTRVEEFQTHYGNIEVQ